MNNPIITPIYHKSREIAEAKRNGLHTYTPGIRIGTSHVFQCAANLPKEDATAVRWLAGYARLMGRTADSYAETLGMEPVCVRAAMVDPAMDAEVRARFTGAVAELRESFESRLDQPYTRRNNPFPPAFERAYGALANTAVFRKVKNAVKFAERECAIVRLLAKERIGKSVSAAHQFLRRLDTAAWVRVPSGDNIREFMGRVAEGVGVRNAEGTAPAAYLSGQIEKVLGPGKIETVFLDQSHWLWPTKADKGIARRFEAVMDWWEQLGVSFVLLTTPQDDEQRVLAASNDKHAYGQITGRVTTYKCRDYLDDADIRAIVQLDAADLDSDCVDALVEHCKADAGYLGTLRLTIKRITDRVANDRPRPGETATTFHKRVVAEIVAKGGHSNE